MSGPGGPEGKGIQGEKNLMSYPRRKRLDLAERIGLTEQKQAEVVTLPLREYDEMIETLKRARDLLSRL